MPSVSDREAETRKRAKRIAVSATRDAAGKAMPTETWVESDFGAMLMRARWDIDYFAEELLGIKGHAGQKSLWDIIIKRNQTGWQPRYLTIACSAGNRAGKTLGISIPMLHATLFKMGLQPPNPMDEKAVERWLKLDYEWYHFAIAQETSELVFIELTRILAGTHEAQKNGCPLTKMLGRPLADWQRKYRGEYLWIQLAPVFGGGQIHFRTTGEKAIGSLGKDMNGISYDECGFDPHFEFIINEVLNLRRLSTGGQMWLIGTPTEGLTAFADKWEEGNPEAPDRKVDSYSLRMSTRDNIGYGISETNFDRMLDSIPFDLQPQNIDGFFIQGAHAFFSAASINEAFVEGLPEVTAAQRNHRYVQGVDPALTFDSTWGIVLDNTIAGFGMGVFAARQRGRTTGPVIAALATNGHNAYKTSVSTCRTGIDATGFGGKMFRDLLYITPLTAVEFGGTRGKKLMLLNGLKLMLEKGQLKFPRSGLWLILRRQLLGYRLDDKGLETDAVMALAVAVSLITKTASAASVPFDFFHTGASGVVSGPTVGGPRFASYASLRDMTSRTG